MIRAKLQKITKTLSVQVYKICLRHQVNDVACLHIALQKQDEIE